MKLLIAIPALNEEKSIGGVIESTLAARAAIAAESPVNQVEITVVSDGSTDRTVEIARRYGSQINLIVFEHNRGYGAAIKEAWHQSDAELLGFMDADGTCNPRFFGILCRELDANGADIALGARLGLASHIPVVRRIGNLFFVLLLTLFSSRRVRDAASGMRVVRRSSLPKLMPLPDGLHFTPAMSARAVLADDVKILEIDMPYNERTGKSKLAVVKDGIRFLSVILEATFLYRPSRPLALFGLLCFAIAFILMVNPVLYYLQHRSVLEWMIYRFIVGDLLGTASCLFLCASYLSGKVVRITLFDRLSSRRGRDWLDALFTHPLFWLAPAALLAIGGALVASSFLQLVRTGMTYEHWSRFVAMSFVVSLAITLTVTRLLSYMLDLITARLAYERHQRGPLPEVAARDSVAHDPTADPYLMRSAHAPKRVRTHKV